MFHAGHKFEFVLPEKKKITIWLYS